MALRLRMMVLREMRLLRMLLETFIGDHMHQMTQ